MDRLLVQKIERVLLKQDLAAKLAPLARSPTAEESLSEGKSFTVYFGFDESTLDRDQIGNVAAACRYALTLPAAEFVISGHADTAGPEAYNDRLSRARAQSVAAAIRSDEHFREALSIMSFGERLPAVETGDEVPEPRNRRVVIDVIRHKPAAIGAAAPL